MFKRQPQPSIFTWPFYNVPLGNYVLYPYVTDKTPTRDDCRHIKIDRDQHGNKYVLYRDNQTKEFKRPHIVGLLSQRDVLISSIISSKI